MKTAFLYSEKFGSFSYGPAHPMKPERLRLTYDLIRHLELIDEGKLVEARRATDAEITTFHSPEYLRSLKAADSGVETSEGAPYGLGFGDNPVFPGVFEWSSYSAGASVQAAELVATGKADIAFNICGGLHHAMKERASGFCYINDAVLAINYLLSIGKRVAYIDIDAHHGDGVERAFFDTNQVLTISLHESGDYLFPGTGYSRDIGTGAGEGFSVNLPLPPYTGDALFTRGIIEVVTPFIEAFSPDLLVTQLGVDSMKSDPITHLNLTSNAFEGAVWVLKSLGLPWVALGGGGYDLTNVARCWTLAWAVMLGAELPDMLEEEFRSEILPAPIKRLRDLPESSSEGGTPGEVDIERLLRVNLPLVLKGR